MASEQEEQGEGSQNRLLPGARFRKHSPQYSRPNSAGSLRGLGHQRRRRATDRHDHGLCICDALTRKRPKQNMASATISTRIVYTRSSNRATRPYEEVAWRARTTRGGRRDRIAPSEESQHNCSHGPHEEVISLHALLTHGAGTVSQAPSSLRSSQSRRGYSKNRTARCMDEVSRLPGSSVVAREMRGANTISQYTMHRCIGPQMRAMQSSTASTLLR